MSDFDQTLHSLRRHAAEVSGTRGCVMSKINEFWQYAKEAVLSARDAKSKEERQALLHLARTWTQAALMERRAQANTGN